MHTDECNHGVDDGKKTPETVPTEPYAPAKPNMSPSEPVETATPLDQQQGGAVVTPKFDGVSLSPAPTAKDGHPTQLPPGHVIVAAPPTLDGGLRLTAPPTLTIIPQGDSANDYSGGGLAPTLQKDPKFNTRTPTLTGSQAPATPEAVAAIGTGLIGQ